jgi:membrane-associated protease RseP (regulator of RpoE activity)
VDVSYWLILLKPLTFTNSMAQPTETVTPTANQVPRQPRPTARQWLLHALFFVATLITTTICGIYMTPPETFVQATPAETGGFGGSVWLIPWYYVLAVFDIVRAAFANPYYLKEGLIFSGSLLAILASHESGHYVFCRRYGVDATLPFFIPQPPLFMPGTFGAFIRMKSPVPSRRALFDIGLAGPLAGFVVLVPIAIAGVLNFKQADSSMMQSGGLEFHDPLLFRLIAWALRVPLENGLVNSFYLAAWFGALVTALNLMPVGQLDGGHGTFSVFGRVVHQRIGLVAFVAMAATSILGWFWHGSPAGFVYVALLAVMLRVRHPEPQQMEPLGRARIIIAIVTLVVFALCFLPFPITIT